MKKKSKRVTRVPTKNADTVDKLYLAVQKYVEDRGGKIVVIGGIQIQEWPDDPKGSYLVAVRCLGKKPEKKKDRNFARSLGED